MEANSLFFLSTASAVNTSVPPAAQGFRIKKDSCLRTCLLGKSHISCRTQPEISRNTQDRTSQRLNSKHLLRYFPIRQLKRPKSVTRQHAFMQTTQFLHDQGLHLIAVRLRHLRYGLRNGGQRSNTGQIN